MTGLGDLLCLYCPHPARDHDFIERENWQEKWRRGEEFGDYKCRRCTCTEFDIRLKGEVEGITG